MKICIAQTKPVKGDIQQNIERHKTFVDLARANGAAVIIFPELSSTAYEPTLAKELAIDQEDIRFDVFQKLANAGQLVIGVGVPTKCAAGICISLMVFQPGNTRCQYSKKYLHADEEPFFVCGENLPILEIDKIRIGLAICYELSVPEHSERAYNNGAQIYLTSVAKSVSGVEKASKTLGDIARNYSMTVLMSNCVGYFDNTEMGGGSAIWNDKGFMIGQLNDRDEGILIIDTATQEMIKRYL
jgi:predicted amidohydrolase